MRNIYLLRKGCIVLVFLNIFFSQINAAEDTKPSKPSLILLSRTAGFFSVFFEVLSLIKCYEKGLYSSFEVNFENGGLYYSPKYGPNWWQYYFEPIVLGTHNNDQVIRVLGDGTKYFAANDHIKKSSRKDGYSFIKKYIRIKPNVQEKIDSFVSNKFQNNLVIGVHYRGTDKNKVRPRVAYETVLSVLKDEIQKLENNDFKIFVATDEAPFLEYIKSIYPDDVCFNENAFRSINQYPVHQFWNPSRYERGEDALIDCILLSKTDLLLRTDSNLSLASGYFNPDLPVIEIRE